MQIIKKGLFILVLGSLSSSVFAAIKIGTIDAQELFSKSPQSSAAEQKIVKEFKPREDKVIAKRKELEDKLQNYQRDKDILSAKESLDREREINRLSQEYQRMASELDVDLRVRRNEELAAFDKIFRQAVEDIAKKEQYDLILPSQTVIYADKKIDLTNEVLKVLKQQFKK